MEAILNRESMSARAGLGGLDIAQNILRIYSHPNIRVVIPINIGCGCLPYPLLRTPNN